MFDAIAERKLRVKAQTIHDQLLAGTARYEQFKGKRLTCIDRQIIAVPITLRYRMVYRESAGRLDLLAVLTHERYNTYINRFR